MKNKNTLKHLQSLCGGLCRAKELFLNRMLAFLMWAEDVLGGIWAEIQRILEKILESAEKTKQKASRKRLLGHQFIAFFTGPHRFGRCKERAEGVTEVMIPKFGTLPGCIPAIS